MKPPDSVDQSNVSSEESSARASPAVTENTAVALGSTIITLDGEYATVSELSAQQKFVCDIPLHPSDPELSHGTSERGVTDTADSLPPTPPPLRPKPEFPKPEIARNGSERRPTAEGQRAQKPRQSLRRMQPYDDFFDGRRMMVYPAGDYLSPAFPVFHTWQTADFAHCNLRLNSANRVQSEASQSVCENIFDGSEISSSASRTQARPNSPFYAMPREERLIKSGSETESKDATTNASANVFRTPRRPLSRNPLYSSMPKLNSQSHEYKSKHFQHPNGPRPAVSWSHLGPTSYQNANYPSQRAYGGYHHHQMQNPDAMRNIFPYTTLYARRAPVKFPTMNAGAGAPPPRMHMAPNSSFRRLPSSYKRYFTQSTRRSRSGVDSTKMSSRKHQPRIYEIFQDEAALESNFGASVPMSAGAAQPTPVFFVPATHMQPPAVPTPTAMPPTEMWNNGRDNGSNYTESVAATRRKSAGKNCMIGWMLAVTALIILALAIALFIQVSKDANELNQLRSAVAADLGLEDETPSPFGSK